MWKDIIEKKGIEGENKKNEYRKDERMEKSRERRKQSKKIIFYYLEL